VTPATKAKRANPTITTTARVSPFYRWLTAQAGRGDVIGDLAKDAMSDGSFPVEAKTRKEIEAHLRMKRACFEAIDALHEAWKEFKNNAA